MAETVAGSAVRHDKVRECMGMMKKMVGGLSSQETRLIATGLYCQHTADDVSLKNRDVATSIDVFYT